MLKNTQFDGSIINKLAKGVSKIYQERFWKGSEWLTVSSDIQALRNGKEKILDLITRWSVMSSELRLSNLCAQTLQSGWGGMVWALRVK